MFQNIPGKPQAHRVGSNEIELHWSPPTEFGNEDYYQLSYKERQGKWKFDNDEFPTATAQLQGLKAHAPYIFRFRVVTPGGEGPYSEESDEITTKQSLGKCLVGFATLKVDQNPAKYAIPLTELQQARNAQA